MSIDLRAYTPKKIYLRWKIGRDQKILLEAGLREAQRQGLEINVATEYILGVPKSEKTGSLYLPPEDSRGNIDLTPILSLGVKENPDAARRWLRNRERLRPQY